MVIDEEHIAKALTREAQWRIPEDNVAARKMDSTAAMLSETDSPVSMAVRKMARAACGLEAVPVKRKNRIGLF